MLQRITVTVPKPLLRDAERVAHQRGVKTRSALVVDALKHLVEAARARAADAELDAYYGSRGTEERAEEDRMVRAFRRSRRRLDVDREGR